jgi:hypothetical protein
MTFVKTRSTSGVEQKSFHLGAQLPSTLRGGGTERIEGINHPGYQAKLGTSTDVGGPMKLERSVIDCTFIRVISGTKQGSDLYMPSYSATGRPSIETDSQVKALGTTGIARSAPTNPVFDASTFIGEAVHGGLPAIAGVNLWREKTAYYRGLSSEYLNYQFGWVPFVNDIRNFAHAVKNSTTILEDFRAGSGKNTRVGYHFPENVFNSSNQGTVNSVRSDGILGESGSCYNFEQSGSKVWFNGCFTYYIPMGNDTASKMQRYGAYANKLLGVRITPEVLWNLTPWSWALDWFGNTGDVLSNLSMLGNDGLVLKYGYVMRHNYAKTQRTWIKDAHGGRTAPGVGSTRRLQEVKTRFPASPYRLFAESAPLSATQIAVITALGLNRA